MKHCTGLGQRTARLKAMMRQLLTRGQPRPVSPRLHERLACAELLERRLFLTATFSITDLGVNFSPIAINDLGVVIGTTNAPGSQHQALAAQTPGGEVMLPELGTSATVSAINNSDEIVGTDSQEGITYPALWHLKSGTLDSPLSFTETLVSQVRGGRGVGLTDSGDFIDDSIGGGGGDVWLNGGETRIHLTSFAPIGIASDDALIGVENVSGTTGISYIGTLSNGLYQFQQLSPINAPPTGEILSSLKLLLNETTTYIVGGTSDGDAPLLTLCNPSGASYSNTFFGPGYTTGFAIMDPTFTRATSDQSSVVAIGNTYAFSTYDTDGVSAPDLWISEGDPSIGSGMEPAQPMSGVIRNFTQSWSFVDGAATAISSVGQIIGAASLDGAQHGFLLTPIDSIDAAVRGNEIAGEAMPLGQVANAEVHSGPRTLDTGADQDWFTFTLSQPSSVTLSTAVPSVAALPPCAGIGEAVYAEDGSTRLGAGPGPVNLLPGKYFVEVSRAPSSEFPVGNYELGVAAAPLSVSAGVGASGAARNISFAAGLRGVYTDAQRHRVVVSLRGAGSGVLLFNGGEGSDAAQVTLTGTNGNSVVTINGKTVVGTIIVHGSLGELQAPSTALIGGIAADGSIGTVRFASIIDDQGSAAGGVSTVSLNELVVKGNLSGEITAGLIGDIIVGGSIIDAEVVSASSINSVVASSIADTQVFAGMRQGLESVPSSVDDFANQSPTASIISLVVRRRGACTNVDVASWVVGVAYLGTADSDWVAAHSLSTLRVFAGGHWQLLTDPTTTTFVGDTGAYIY